MKYTNEELALLNQYMYILRAKNNEKEIALPGVRRYFTDLHSSLLKNPKLFISDIEKIINIWKDVNDSEEIKCIKKLLLRFYVSTL